MPRVIGLLNLHNAPNLGKICENRALSSVSFLGRYAVCDIPLSNFANSGIDSVGILVKRCPRSMIMHLEGKLFSSNSKLGKTSICYNEKYANDPRYNTDINNIIENKWFIDESNSKYIIIASSHILYRMDFKDLIKAHEESGAKCTIAYKKISTGKSEFINHQILEIDENGYLRDIYRNKGLKEEVNVSLGTLIINTDVLLELCQIAHNTSTLFTITDVIKYLIPKMEFNTYQYSGYLRAISSLKNYLDYSLELLDFDVLKELVSKDWPIYTKTHDTPPTRYLEDAWVRNSFISNGALIDGKVENSVICRDVKIGKNSIVRNSIVLSNTVISENTILENVIVDKNAKILHVKELRGDKDNPLYIGQGDTV